MIIDLFKIKKSGKQSEAIRFEYVTENELSTLPDVKVKMPIKVSGEVTLTGDHSAYVDCEVKYILEGECTRCLAETEKEYTADICEECDGESVYKVVKDKIDLAKIVEDAILTDMPVNFLCSDDCKGICTGCGVNLNVEKCKCKNE